MPYKLSERLEQDKPKFLQKSKGNQEYLEGIDYEKIAKVFFIFAFISFCTALYNWGNYEEIFTTTITPVAVSADDEDSEPKRLALIGPIEVKNKSEILGFQIKSNLGNEKWEFIEADVLDQDKEYLFSFGQELWDESGRDNEGYWHEREDSYEAKISFPKEGKFYISLKTQSDNYPSNIKIIVKKYHASPYPHGIFGLICMIIGLVMDRRKVMRLLKMWSD